MAGDASRDRSLKSSPRQPGSREQLEASNRAAAEAQTREARSSGWSGGAEARQLKEREVAAKRQRNTTGLETAVTARGRGGPAENEESRTRLK